MLAPPVHSSQQPASRSANGGGATIISRDSSGSTSPWRRVKKNASERSAVAADRSSTDTDSSPAAADRSPADADRSPAAGPPPPLAGPLPSPADEEEADEAAYPGYNPDALQFFSHIPHSGGTAWFAPVARGAVMTVTYLSMTKNVPQR